MRKRTQNESTLHKHDMVPRGTRIKSRKNIKSEDAMLQAEPSSRCPNLLPQESGIKCPAKKRLARKKPEEETTHTHTHKKPLKDCRGAKETAKKRQKKRGVSSRPITVSQRRIDSFMVNPSSHRYRTEPRDKPVRLRG